MFIFGLGRRCPGISRHAPRAAGPSLRSRGGGRGRSLARSLGPLLMRAAPPPLPLPPLLSALCLALAAAAGAAGRSRGGQLPLRRPPRRGKGGRGAAAGARGGAAAAAQGAGPHRTAPHLPGARSGSRLRAFSPASRALLAAGAGARGEPPLTERAPERVCPPSVPARPGRRSGRSAGTPGSGCPWVQPLLRARRRGK